MNFLIFFLYLTLSIIIYGIIGVFLYKLIFKKKNEDSTLRFDDLLNVVNTELNKNFDKDFWSDSSKFDQKNDNKKDEDKKNEKIYSSF